MPRALQAPPVLPGQIRPCTTRLEAAGAEAESLLLHDDPGLSTTSLRPCAGEVAAQVGWAGARTPSLQLPLASLGLAG